MWGSKNKYKIYLKNCECTQMEKKEIIIKIPSHKLKYTSWFSNLKMQTKHNLHARFILDGPKSEITVELGLISVKLAV